MSLCAARINNPSHLFSKVRWSFLVFKNGIQDKPDERGLPVRVGTHSPLGNKIENLRNMGVFKQKA